MNGEAMNVDRSISSQAVILSGADWVGGDGGSKLTWMSMGIGDSPELIPSADKTAARRARFSIELCNANVSDRLETSAVDLPGKTALDVVKELMLTARYFVHAYPVLTPTCLEIQPVPPAYLSVTMRLHIEFESLKSASAVRVTTREIAMTKQLVQRQHVWQMAIDFEPFFAEALRSLIHGFPHWD